MKKFSNVVLMTLLAALLVAAPACRSRKVVPPPNTGANTTTMPAVPNVDPPPAQNTDQTVEATEDFVRETNVQDDVIPSNIEDLNRYARERGWIRDAFYNYDEGTLDDSAQAALQSSATWLRSDQGRGYNLLVEGHCDERGTEQYNLALGERRAEAAASYLAALGVDRSRIQTIGLGEERPFAHGSNEAAWTQNRRAHLAPKR